MNPFLYLGILLSLPSVRCVGKSWSMTKERAYFEAVTLKGHGGLCLEHVPQLYHFVRTMSLIARIEISFLAEPMSEYMNFFTLKLGVAKLKSKFCERAQALVHGDDLHTGSIMVNRDSTRVIDLEFAFYGLMGRSVGHVEDRESIIRAYRERQALELVKILLMKKLEFSGD